MLQKLTKKGLTGNWIQVNWICTQTIQVMASHPGWVPAYRIEELLGIDKKTLYKFRDNGTLRLGPHYAAFPETRSRDSFRWNVNAIRKALAKLEVAV